MDDPTKIELNGIPLTCELVYRFLAILSVYGELHVTGAPIDSSAPERIMGYLRSKLSEHDKAWIKEAIAEQVAKVK